MADWNALEVSFSAPIDDGGSDVTGYTVQWYDATAVPTALYDIQTIKISSTVIGGTFTLLSPGGFSYPYPIPYNIDPDSLRGIIERLPDVGKVRVAQTSIAPADTVFTVTFLAQPPSSLQPLPPLMLDSSSLITTDQLTAIVCSAATFVAALATSLGCAATDSQTGSGFPTVFSSGPTGPFPVVDTMVGST